MDKFKKTIIALCIAIVVIIIVLILMLNATVREDENIETLDNDQETEQNIREIQKNDTDKVEMYDYFVLDNAINQYLKKLNKHDDAYYVKDETGNMVYEFNEQNFKTDIYSILDENYISENKITLDNLYKYIKTIEESYIMTITDVKTINKNDSIDSYKVKGIVQKNNYDKTRIGNGYYIINICSLDTTFSIRPISKEIYESSGSIKVVESINKKAANMYTEPEVTNQTTAIKHFNIMKNLILGSPTDAYEKMSKDYKESRFGNLQGFEKYAQEIKEKVKTLTLKQFMANRYDEYVEYICKDQYENLYVIDEKDANNYTIMLDTHTINSSEFVEKYDKGNNQVKVGMNIEKIKSAMNTKDYNYIYNKLDETFRKKNYGSLEQFKEYIQKNFFDSNNFTYSEYKEEGNTYIYNIKVSDMENENSSSKNLTIIMQLKENRDFVMSFSMK